MFDQASEIYRAALQEIETAGLSKEERVLTTPQGARVRTTEKGPAEPGV